MTRQYFELAGVIFVSLDIDGKIKLINRTGCHILGYETKGSNDAFRIKDNGFINIIGKDWFDLFIPEENREYLRKMHREHIQEQKEDPKEFYDNEVLCKDGSRKMISWHNRIIRDEKGIIIGSLSSGMDITERVKIENELKEERERAEKMMMDALLEGQEKERQRIAADLHDSIQPLLSTIKRKVEAFKPFVSDLSKEKKKEYLQITSLLNEALVEVKAISYNLVPPTLKEFGLINTLQDLCENMDQAGKANVQFIATNLKEKIRSEVEIGLYRIAQELLTNSLKHSSADLITLQLIGHPTSLMLLIEDNGVGFDNKSRKSGLGIKNIISRVKALDGELHVDSMTGKGTTIIIEIPRKKTNFKTTISSEV